LLIPVFSEIRVRFIKHFNDRVEYKFVTHLQSDDFIDQSFNQFSWYLDLLDHVKKFKGFKETKAYQDQFYQSKLETDWISSTPNRVQEDILGLYYKALNASVFVNLKNSSSYYIEASSFKVSISIPYYYKLNPFELLTSYKKI
jgi:hypothetical protein